MPLQDFKVLTFDVVGTLIDFERGMLDYLRRADGRQERRHQAVNTAFHWQFFFV